MIYFRTFTTGPSRRILPEGRRHAARVGSPKALGRGLTVSRRSALVVAVVVIIVAGTAGYAYMAPYLTVSQMQKAAARGDAETVNAHVDFPALRASVKGWMGAVVAKEMSKQDFRDNPFVARLHAALGRGSHRV